MTLADLLFPGRVIVEMQSDEHIPAIVELIDHLVAGGTLPADKRDEAIAALRHREEQRSTGIGGGVAIPHCFLPGLEQVVAIFGRSTDGIDFSAVDLAPVHFVVLFMVPEAEHSLHLQTLAAIAKTLNSAELRNRLAAAVDESDLLEVLAPKNAAA